MAKVAKDIVETRPKEIIDACRKLYKTMAFQKITLKDISEETSLSRPSIYNYFQTKEEIFLAILENEYIAWNRSLRKILEDNEKLDADAFAEKIADSMRSRELLLKIQCMNLYEIEEHSREERLVGFKCHYKEARDLVESCLAKFFPELSENTREDFIYEFFPFMYGIYPYVHPTGKQREAMKKANLKPARISVYEMTRRCVRTLLLAMIAETAPSPEEEPGS